MPAITAGAGSCASKTSTPRASFPAARTRSCARWKRSASLGWRGRISEPAHRRATQAALGSPARAGTAHTNVRARASSSRSWKTAAIRAPAASSRIEGSRRGHAFRIDDAAHIVFEDRFQGECQLRAARPRRCGDSPAGRVFAYQLAVVVDDAHQEHHRRRARRGPHRQHGVADRAAARARSRHTALCAFAADRRAGRREAREVATLGCARAMRQRMRPTRCVTVLRLLGRTPASISSPSQICCNGAASTGIPSAFQC